jgi:hypothetical protein
MSDFPLPDGSTVFFIFGARHLKTHEVFQGHLGQRESEVFCPEPVHPNRTGHLVIAEALYRLLCG